MRRSLASLGTPGGRLAVSAILVVGVVAGVGIALAMGMWRPGDPLDVQVVQDGLEHPWDIAFAEDGRMLVTERAGRVLVFEGPEADAPLLHTATVPDVRTELESGLMGIAVHGETVFVCATRGEDAADRNAWRVEVLHSSLAADGSLTAFEPLPIGRAQGGPRHQGCAVEVGPDEHLWVTFGDANLPAGANRAQDPASLNGKVVRLDLDGSVPSDAPFASGAYSIGHRNPQGIAFTTDGRVLAVEHGTDVNDEINLVVAGRNYGYPCLTGAESEGPIPDACQPDAELTAPAWASGAATLATSGAAVLPDEGWGDWAGSLAVTTLKEEDLRRFAVDANESVQLLDTLLDRRYGRLRAATIGPDRALYVSTSNGNDDRILRITLADPANGPGGD